MMMVDVPDALANEPLSPVFPSQLETIVPSGKVFTGKIFPTDKVALEPA